MDIHPELKFATDFLAINNFLLHYVQTGSGPPLILIHGGGSWLYSFRHNIYPLSEKFSVFAFDMPGHGYTQAQTDDQLYNVDTVCTAILEFMNVMDLKKVHVAGHSWGGGWAVAFAEQYPERVNQLILINSSGIHRFEQLGWELMKYRFLEKLALKVFSEKSVKKGLKKCFYNKSLVNQKMIKSIYTPLSNKNILKAQLNYSQNINWRKIRRALPLIRSQTLILRGKNDPYIHVKYCKRLAHLIPAARIKLIDQCGHSAHEEQPDRVNQLITDFLA